MRNVLVCGDQNEAFTTHQTADQVRKLMKVHREAYSNFLGKVSE